MLLNGGWSDLVQIGRGTRQGDPPSSLLYVLVAEVFAGQIRGNPRIEGIRIGGVEKKVGQYVDDTQAFVSSDASFGPFMEEVSL